MIQVASYCRVSTDKQDQANSFETQQKYFREYIQHEPNWELYEVYADEGISGTSTKRRTQFNRMINDAYEGKFQLILTKEVSRFSRNILDTISYTRELKSIGVGVIFVTDRINTLDPEAEMLLSFLASLAQEESRRTSDRVVWGQTRQMEKGVVFGPSLLGYDVKDGKIAVNPEGAEIVRLIFQKYAVERISTSEIANYLTKAGYRTYRGTQWKPNSIIKILKNEKYVGDLVQKKSYTPDYLTHEKRKNMGQVPLIRFDNHHEPIIEREIWNLAQELLRKNNKRRDTNTGHSNRYVFSGKIKCGECGASFVGRFKYLKDGTRIRRWSCAIAARAGLAACDVGKLIRDDDAVQMLKTALKKLKIDRGSIANNVAVLAFNAILTGKINSAQNPERLRIEISRIQKKKESVMDSYFSQELSKEDMLVMKERYASEIATLRLRLEEAEQFRTEQNKDSDLKTTIVSEVASILAGEIESEMLYKIILHKITIFKDRHIELRMNHLNQVFLFIG